MALFSKLFKSYSEKQIQKIQPIASQVEALSERYQAMSDAELGGTTVRLRAELQSGKTLDDLLPDAFAAVREAAVQTGAARE